jgi:hypothetical protein
LSIFDNVKYCDLLVIVYKRRIDECPIVNMTFCGARGFGKSILLINNNKGKIKEDYTWI